MTLAPNPALAAPAPNPVPIAAAPPPAAGRNLQAARDLPREPGHRTETPGTEEKQQPRPASRAPESHARGSAHQRQSASKPTRKPKPGQDREGGRPGAAGRRPDAPEGAPPSGAGRSRVATRDLHSEPGHCSEAPHSGALLQTMLMPWAAWSSTRGRAPRRQSAPEPAHKSAPG